MRIISSMPRQKFGSIERILIKLQQQVRFSCILCPALKYQDVNAYCTQVYMILKCYSEIQIVVLLALMKIRAHGSKALQ